MRKSVIIFPVLAVLFLSIVGCSSKWTQAIRSGHTEQNKFFGQADLEIHQGLIFASVTIKGKNYRFLFDTGAPFSISNHLQKELNFNIVSKGNIRDSDGNRKQVNWVQVDSLIIGDVSFLDQIAFIGDFEANPVLKCLDIDGIIGSNLIRHCNWTIDQSRSLLTLNDESEGLTFNGGVTLPFTTDNQYNILINLTLGQATIKNVLVDFGSNGSISLDNEIFSVLKRRNIIGESAIEEGMQQSGIVGKSIPLNREIAYSDSISMDSIHLKNVMLRTGKTTSIGTGFLSRFKITIDWHDKKLHLLPAKTFQETNRISGFRLGFSPTQGIYVQSVVRNSNAYNRGIRPKMKVLKLDGLNFESGHDFCDYVNHTLDQRVYMELIDSTGIKKGYFFEQMMY